MAYNTPETVADYLARFQTTPESVTVSMVA